MSTQDNPSGIAPFRGVNLTSDALELAAKLRAYHVLRGRGAMPLDEHDFVVRAKVSWHFAQGTSGPTLGGATVTWDD